MPAGVGGQRQGEGRALVERAAAAGYEALVLTVDLPRVGRRERDIRVGSAGVGIGGSWSGAWR